MTDKERYKEDKTKWVMYNLDADGSYYRVHWNKIYCIEFDFGHKLILTEHSHIADAIIADSSVRVEVQIYKTINSWCDEEYFFEEYDSDTYNYRLAETKEEKEDMETKEKITRVEVIGLKGREYVSITKYNTYIMSLQDEGRTLKLFEQQNNTDETEDERDTSIYSNGNDTSNSDTDIREILSITDEDTGKVYEFEKPEMGVKLYGMINGDIAGAFNDNDYGWILNRWRINGISLCNSCPNLTPITTYGEKMKKTTIDGVTITLTPEQVAYVTEQIPVKEIVMCKDNRELLEEMGYDLIIDYLEEKYDVKIIDMSRDVL